MSNVNNSASVSSDFMALYKCCYYFYFFIFFIPSGVKIPRVKSKVIIIIIIIIINTCRKIVLSQIIMESVIEKFIIESR